MDKVDITIQIEVGRLKALDFFLCDKHNTSLKAELEKAMEDMYEKHVPEDTRRFIDSQMKPASAPKPRTRRNSKNNVAKASDSKDAISSTVDMEEE